MNFFYFAALLALSSVFVAQYAKGDPDCEAPVTVTKLDFYNSQLTNNTLHLPGGEIRYSNVGTFQNNPIDMVVTDATGDYHTIVDRWIGKGRQTIPWRNGLNGYFGIINVHYKKGEPLSGTGNFRFCIVDSNTNNPVTLTNFSWTVWDLDERGDDTGSNGIGIKEKMMMNASQAKKLSLFPNFAASEVSVNCENPDGSPNYPVPATDADLSEIDPTLNICPNRTLFRSCCSGGLGDNPADPENLTYLAQSRAISFFFENTSCWTFSYAMYCPLEVGGGNLGACRGGTYSGGNFLFAGESDALFYEQGCPTSAPSQSPTPIPTVPPTPAPTSAPSESPTPAPTDPPGYISVAFIRIKDLADQGLASRKRGR